MLPLHAAAGAGDCQTLRRLLQAGVQTGMRDAEGWTAAHYAAEKGNIDALRVLRDFGDDFRDVGPNGQSLAAIAAAAGQIGALSFLSTECGVDITARANAETLLHVAARFEQPAVAEWLLDRGIAVDARDERGGTPLHIAVINGDGASGNWQTAQVLLRRGADVNATTSDGLTPLHCAAYCQRSMLIGDLLSAGARVAMRSSTGHTPAMYARNVGRLDIARMLGG